MRGKASEWFQKVRDDMRWAFELIEQEYAERNTLTPSQFTEKTWNRKGGGGGVMSIMRGNVFEKVGVNFSSVHGEFSSEFRNKIPGAKEDPKFFATGVSVVAHPMSPLVPAMHFNTRYIETTKSWFGGGADLTPTYPNDSETAEFHNVFKAVCDRYDEQYYPKFKKQCDEYFYLKHRNEPRGVGGIFYDYLSEDNAFAFTKDVGLTITRIYPKIVRHKMYLPWNDAQKEKQLIKRGRYVEFNLLYDRGTTFGLATGGNVEAILMSLPPEVKWP